MMLKKVKQGVVDAPVGLLTLWKRSSDKHLVAAAVECTLPGDPRARHPLQVRLLS